MSQSKKTNKAKTAAEMEQKGQTSADKAAIKKGVGDYLLDIGSETFGDVSEFDAIDDLVEPIFERSVGVATNIGISFGIKELSTAGGLAALLDSVDVANDLIKEINAENRAGENFCKLTASKEVKDPGAISFGEATDFCLSKSLLYKKGAKIGESSDTVETISNVLDFISELGRPANPAECINPYFDQFFNLIPLQFLINKSIRDLIKEALEGLTEKEIQQTIRNIQPCGAELEILIRNKEIQYPDIFPLLTLPAIPTIPNLNLYTVLRRLIIELICYIVCITLTPLLTSASKLILEGLNDYAKKDLSEAGTGTFRQLVANSLKKINLNDYIEAAVINEAVRQNKVGGLIEAKIIVLGKPDEGAIHDRFGLWRPLRKDEEGTALSGVRNLIRKYFDAIFNFKSEPYRKQVFDPKGERFVFIEEDPETGEKIRRELGTKEMVYMLFGEYNCLTMADLISVGKQEEFKLLRLNTEERIVSFYKFIGVDFDAFSVIEDLKTCPPEPCAKLDEEVVDATQKRLAQLCKILNFKSGLPPIPINDVLKAMKIDQLFNQGVKQQFNILKTEYLLYLGYPSIKSFPKSGDINPFPPKETGSLDDYEIVTNGTITNLKVFRDFMLRGGPPLFWEYDDVNLNKNLEGAKLEDVCGEDETFEQTFAYIFNNIFQLKADDISEQENNDKKDSYKNIFENKFRQEYERREV